MHTPLYRKANYLVLSNTGIYTFRWNLRADNKHYQPKLSLKTRSYLEAMRQASVLAIQISSLHNPTIEDVRAIYSDFSGKQKKSSTLLKGIDITSYLSDLSLKSQAEYRNCWVGFVSTLSPSTTLESIRQAHIEQWKETQTCSLTTMKKKLRLISSCFSKLGQKVDQDWFKLKVEKKPVRPKRALSDTELKQLLQATSKFKDDKENWKYYLPRIAAMTGCRLNEIAQLRVGDIELGDAPTLSINDNQPEKKLKNASSNRLLPLTDSLKQLFEALTKGKGKKALLFDLPYSEQNGYVNKPSKFFSALFKKSGVSGVSFHSLRHYAVTKLFNSGVREELIGSLMGHAIGKTTSGKVYMNGFSYQQRLSALNGLALKEKD